MNPPAFELANVSKSYKVGDGEITILKNINLKIPAGQYAAIVGPSGSGKSTLMHLLGCLDMPSSGKLSVLGKSASDMTDDQLAALRCRSMGFVFQGFHLLSCYDAHANVALSMAYGGRKDRWPRAKKILETLGLGHRLDHRPRALSGGEQQRVAIGRAVANDPKILLADEPTGALDTQTGQAILGLFDSLHKQGRTVIVVTHDMNVAKRAQRIVEIIDGQIRRDGPAH